MDKQLLLMILMPVMYLLAIVLCGWVAFNFMSGVVTTAQDNNRKP